MNITYPALSAAINASGHAMWLSCSWPCYIGGCGGGPSKVPAAVYAQLAESCNTWRDFNDMYDNQDSLYNVIGAYPAPLAVQLHNAVLQPGAISDADMLAAGGGGLSTALEEMQMVMLAMFNSPLMMSNDLPNIEPESRALLLNREVIAISQDMAYATFNVTDDHTFCRNLAGGAIALAGIHQTSLGPPSNITLSPAPGPASSRLSHCLLPALHAGVAQWAFRDVLRGKDLGVGQQVDCLAAQPGACLIRATPA